MGEERKRILDMLASGKITAEEAESLLDALDAAPPESPPASGGDRPPASKTLKFLRVKVRSAEKDNVDIRVPLDLLRSGMRLTSLIPANAMDHIHGSMEAHGVKIDLNNLKQEDVETLIEGLRDMEVNVDAGSSDRVRVFCE